MKDNNLSRKRMAFVNAYLQCWNASEAARQAGYSAKTAYSAGSFLLRIPEVLREIEARQREHSVSADEVLARLARQARGSFASFLQVSAKGTLEFDFSSLEARDSLQLIKKIRVKRRRLTQGGRAWEYQSLEIELYDAQAALIQIGKHLGLFSERLEIGVPLNIPDLGAMIEKAYAERKRSGREPSQDSNR